MIDKRYDPKALALQILALADKREKQSAHYLDGSRAGELKKAAAAYKMLAEEIAKTKPL